MNVKEANKILAENGIQGELIWAHEEAERIYAGGKPLPPEELNPYTEVEFLEEAKASPNPHKFITQKNQTTYKECNENTGSAAGGESASDFIGS